MLNTDWQAPNHLMPPSLTSPPPYAKIRRRGRLGWSSRRRRALAVLPRSGPLGTVIL